MYTARCAAHGRFIDGMWNGQFDDLQRTNRTVLDRVPSNCGPLQHTSVVGIFWDTLYISGLKFHQVIYESFACDLTQVFFYY